MSELDDLRQAVAELTARVQVLEDHLAITQLVARYGPAVDSGSSDAAAVLWTDDGVFEAPPYAVWTGHDEIAGMVEGEGHQDLIHHGAGHVLTVPHVVVRGDEAEGWSYALNIRWDADAERFWVARVSANGWRWCRTPDGWRITHRVNRNLDGTEAPRAIFRGSAETS